MLRQKNITTIDQEKIIDQLKEYKIVSFDIFDTLIKRDCAEAKLVFEMMEHNLSTKYLWVSNFCERRVNAEKQARAKSTREEVTFDEIYTELGKYYSKEELGILQKEEIEYEIAFCHISYHMKRVYDYCISSKKIVVLTSDMYMPYDIIKVLLEKVGLQGYKKIYLSSQLFLTKQTGHLYDYILKDLKVNSKDVVHIGDNKKSDVLMPMKKGIKSIHVPHVAYSNLIYNPDKILKNDDKNDYRAICSFIDNRIKNEIISDENYYELVGYETEGPLLVGFSKWLKCKFDELDIKKIYFLSRDGQIMEKAYKCIFGEDNKIKYMYASRRSLIVPTLWMSDTLNERVSAMFFPRVGTIGAFIKKMGLEVSKYVSVARKYGLDTEKIYTYRELFDEEAFENFYNEIKEDIYINSKEEYEILIRYLSQIDFSGKVAIVDIGWHGNMQKALVKICEMAGIKADITGFYLGLNPNVDCEKQGFKAKGYLFQKGLNEDYFERQRTFTSIFEMMFTADHGSVRKFALSQERVEPVLEPFEYDGNQSKGEFMIVKKIQNGALRFIEDVVRQPKFAIEWSACSVFHNMILLGNGPDYRASCMFGDIKRLEDNVTYIAKPSKSMVYYLLHPLTLKRELAVNPWKIGFFRRGCKVDFPYYEVYAVMRKVFLLWRKQRKTW